MIVKWSLKWEHFSYDSTMIVTHENILVMIVQCIVKMRNILVMIVKWSLKWEHFSYDSKWSLKWEHFSYDSKMIVIVRMRTF